MGDAQFWIGVLVAIAAAIVCLMVIGAGAVMREIDQQANGVDDWRYD